MNRWSRKLHRWGAIVIAVPTLLVIATGLLLQLKKEVAWIQPPTIKSPSIDGASSQPLLDWDTVLNSTIAIKESGVSSWDDIDRLDVRPSKGVIKVRCKNNWEVQLDANNAAVLSSAYRRSDLIESLHDGSFFSDSAKLYVFFVNGLILLGLWLTGMYLWYLPIKARSKKKNRLASKNSSAPQAE